MPSPSMNAPEQMKTPQGLSSSQVEEQRHLFGWNELPQESVHPLLKFLGYFWGPIPWMIEIAAALSAVVRHWADLIIIGVLLVTNAVVGFWEEFQAGNVVASLKKKLALNARVKRDGRWLVTAARELVPGDLVRVRMGDIVPADAVIESEDILLIDQSTLTGESLPVSRSAGQLLYSGSIVKHGEANAIVKAIGTKSYFGRTAELTTEAKRTSHFQRAVIKIGNFLILVAVALVALILWVSISRHESVLTTVEFCLVLTVAAIPVALPTVLSVTLAIGARNLGRSNAVVTRLASVEEAAGVDVLCCDKTGTLTQNELTLGTPFPVAGTIPDELLLCGALASREEDQDPIDLAILKSVPAEKRLGFITESFQPFDPVVKRSQAQVHGPDGRMFRVAKGAVQAILALSSNAASVRSDVDEQVRSFAHRGFRALGVARSDSQGPWRFIGVLPLFDPPREDSKSTVEMTRNMGIQVKMLTGDQAPIASEIALQLGMGTHILSAEDLHMDTTSKEALASEIERADGFAQVFPEHKFHIVEALQSSNHIVGMTGDGVNDAPALKEADVGIAVAGATDAAREAADVVLMQPGLSTIVAGIQESRKIFKRMRSYATYRIAETIRVLFFMTASILAFNFYPVTAVMIVLLALLNDGAILSIAYDHANISDHPERWNMRGVIGIASLLGFLGVIASFSLFFLAERVFHLPRTTLQTLMYLKLSVAGQLTIFLTRVRGPFWSLKPSPRLLGAVAAAQTIATAVAISGILMPKLPWQWALFVWGYALVWFLINDRMKLLAYRLFTKES